MMREYPTKSQLRKIEKFDVFKKSPLELFHYIQLIWHWPEWGYHEHWGFNIIRRKVFKIELHTGGWSGNESIIAALERNKSTWPFFWEKSIVGGHYYFEIGKSCFEKKED